MEGMRRRLAVAAVVAAGALLAGCGAAHVAVSPLPAGSGAKRPSASHPATPTLFGPFAGFVWLGHVDRLAAVISVPPILSKSHAGFGATWIGAEGPGTRLSLSGSFFQVGVNEVRPVVGADQYVAFWSSSAVGFQAQPLFKVRPGQTVRLAMRLTAGHWLLSAVDESTHASRVISRPVAADTQYVAATWIQEDASDLADQQLPYPQLSKPGFSDLTVNGAEPSKLELTPEWMSAGSQTFQPTPLRNDSFFVRSFRPPAAGVHYQQIVLAYDESVLGFDHDLVVWSSRTPRSVISPAATSFLRVLNRMVARLRGYAWPNSVRVLVRQLAGTCVVLRAVALRLASGRDSVAQAIAVARSLKQYPLSLRIKERLGIPTFGISPALAARFS